MFFNYPLDLIAEITKGELLGTISGDALVEDLIIDSRKFVAGRKSMFIALITGANDGHKFIADLYERGVRSFMVSHMPEGDFQDAGFVLVENTLDALQTLSIYHRKRYDTHVIGVTGSNGKTIVKEWLYQLLSPDFKIVRSPKSYNSQIGVPLSVMQLSPEYELAIFEAGISQPGEMDKLRKIILPQTGIFTNIGHAHDENFVNKLQKINEKLQLFKNCDRIIYCHDHGEINQRILTLENFKNKELISWSFKSRDVALFIKKGKGENSYKCTYKGNTTFDLELPFDDSASAENIFHIVLAALTFGLSPAVIRQRVSELSPVAMRLELKEGVNNCSIINDVYNSDLNSVAIALEFLSQQNRHQRRTVIMSDILQTGMNDYTLYRRVAELVEKRGIDCFIGIGKAIKRQQALFKCEKYFYDTTEDFLHYHPVYNMSNESILLKGARAFEFEKISNRLQQKAHQTVMEINLTALVENLNFYRSLLKAQTGIMAMVKAFSYGSGSFEIANALRYHNVDYLAVAYADEGVELRKAGITLPIMVMNPDENAFDPMIVNNLEPEIYSLSILDKFITAIHENIIPQGKAVGIHIKIDSGMHRLGFEKEELPALIKRLENEKNVEVRTVFSHLVGSDSEQFNDFTHKQAAYFKECCDILEERLQINFKRHILNSGGICRFPEYQFDMVRLGIGLYGFGVCPGHESKLRNVSALKSIITQIKHIRKGESVGYDRSFVAGSDLISATIPIGYADGFDRRLSNGKGHVFINGKAAPVIGKVCMDMIMVDISQVDAQEGQEVVIFDDNFTISDMAKVIGTIPYEVMTSISRRVKRVYFQE